MSFRYFAYGSNMWVPHLRSRCPSARLVGTGRLDGWATVYDKPSTDGSAKLNIRPEPGGTVTGVVFDIDDDDRPALDAAEPSYTPIDAGELGLTYVYDGRPSEARPYDWYVALVKAGAESHGLEGPTVESEPDPIVAGVVPADATDFAAMRMILSDGLVKGATRYYAHPGDLAWWLHHPDPRYEAVDSYWMQGDDCFAVLVANDPGEINLFARPGRDPMPFIRWCQRRLGGGAEVGWVSDDDDELVAALTLEGYGPVRTYRNYRWDLDEKEIPTAELAPGWELRSVRDESEADNRRSASHAAFESTMSAEMHLARYLRFMRSPVYVPERDLVAVAPDGRIAAFMVWWPDSSGIAQIEPFGTHPDYHRKGVGRALIHHGLARMKDAGMSVVRVCTNEPRQATAFYEGVGFTDVGRLRWWSPAS